MMPEDGWQTVRKSGYSYNYKVADAANNGDYQKLIDDGIASVRQFTGSSYKNEFAVYIHPDRASLDQQWQKDWNMPDFKSECWMVASGVGTRLDMIAPKAWDQQSCEHSYKDKDKTQRLITHELFHVYHGQQNVSPDFSEVIDLDWFVEGFATYASGQCDAARMSEVRKAIEANAAPTSLNIFWTGKLKYGLSGSVVMYIDRTYGREKLKSLLPFKKKEDLLNSLGVNEGDLLTGWKDFILKNS